MGLPEGPGLVRLPLPEPHERIKGDPGIERAPHVSAKLALYERLFPHEADKTMATASLDIAKRNPHAAPVAVSEAARLDGIEKVA